MQNINMATNGKCNCRLNPGVIITMWVNLGDYQQMLGHLMSAHLGIALFIKGNVCAGQCNPGDLIKTEQCEKAGYLSCL